jgi:hypothetical protein
MDVGAQQVRDALDVVERYKDEARTGEIRDPLLLANAIQLLRDANETYLIAQANLFGSQDRLLRVMPAASVDAGNSAEGKTVPPESNISYDDMREQVNLAAKSMELEIKVQSYLLPPERVAVAQDMLDKAMNQLHTVQTMQGTQDAMKGLNEVIKQLYSVQKTLV